MNDGFRLDGPATIYYGDGTTEEVGVSPEPECWPHKSKYWGCTGSSIPEKKKRRWPWQKVEEEKPDWSVLNYTKEDAEAYCALRNGKWWEWDGLPAREFSLSDAMYKARISKRAGVQIRSFSDGKWRCVKSYKATEPLPEE